MIVRARGLTAGLAFLTCASVAHAQPARVTETEVYAVRYGTLHNFPTAGLLAGADTSRRSDITLSVWLIRQPDGHNVLLDAGFYREKFITRWKPADYQKPSDAIGALGLGPDDITDIVISHVHWDHLDGADLFPKARIWLQRAEYEHYVDSTGRALDRTIDSLDAAMLHRMRLAGRIQLIEGDSQPVLTGITVYTGGKHTFASEFVSVTTAAGLVVLASDNAYLYENLATQTPIAQTLDPASNRAAQARMLKLAGGVRLVIPGHDPAVYERFPAPGHGIARIR